MKKVVFIVILLSALISLDSYSQSGYAHISYNFASEGCIVHYIYPAALPAQTLYVYDSLGLDAPYGAAHHEAYVKNLVYNQMHEAGYEPVTLGQTRKITSSPIILEVWFKP